MGTSRTPQASYIIPFRATDKQRLQNLLAALDWMASFPALELIIVEQDSQSRLTDVLEDYQVVYSLQKQTALFNKSAALNQGAQLASSNILILADADIIIAHDALELSIIACRDHVDAVNPYTHLFDLSEQQRDDFISDKSLPNNNELGISKRQREGEQICFCGGMFLIKKSVYQSIGGMDEAFQGWGGEDDAMSIKLDKLDVSQLTKHSQTAYHLWHERNQTDRYAQPEYQANLKLLKFYSTMNQQHLKAHIKNDTS